MENSQSNRKISLMIIGVAILVIGLVGVTYAFFNYTRTGNSNNIRVGRISFVSKNEETITLSNIFPIDPTETGIMNDSTKVGTYTVEIEGDTDYADGIEYLVSVVDANIYTNQGQIVPISLDVTVEDLGTASPNYFVARESKNATIYKKLVGSMLVGNQMLLVGYIKPNTTSGTIEGVDGSITIKAYLDKNKILISDTYDGTESDNMGTTNEWANGKTVITTSEWNALQSTGVSFKVKVEANEGIWVYGSLEEIMRKDAVMDNINSDYVDNETPGINFGAISSDTNGKGVYMRAGTQNDTYPILYYRGDVSDNNVIFANKCWKAVRTTDTGGVKMIYNGLPSAVYEKVPLEETSYTIDTTNTDSRWTYDLSDNTWNIEINDNSNPTIEFTVPAGDNYSLVMTGTSGSSCGGNYFFYKNGASVKSYGNGGGSSMNLSHDFGTLTSSDRIKMYYGGSSSSTCLITFKLKMIGQGDLITSDGCANKETDAYISVDVNETPQNMFAFNLNNNSPAYNGYMYGTVYEYDTSGWTSGARFGSDFTWDGTNYTLVDDEATTPNSTHHYSCNVTSESGMCQELRYVYYVTGSAKYYITLTGGDGIEEAIEKMQANTNDSNAKEKIDTWYASNMTGVTNKLEDTIWCNDRSFGDGNNNGWIANGGDLSTYLYYGAYQRSNYASNGSTVKNQPTLACANKNDAFTWKNGNGNQKLQYPTALLTEDEMVLAGGLASSANTFYLYNGNTNYWSLSPSNFSFGHASEFTLGNDGFLGYGIAYYSYGLRPAISIKPGQLITKGTGTTTDPYIVE